ncbi:hypothetical protein DOY81_012646 [Sarcophaga bullata]|nr:hypothetical protein DOY81_012646 [Sarcophaga bullata]
MIPGFLYHHLSSVAAADDDFGGLISLKLMCCCLAFAYAIPISHPITVLKLFQKTLRQTAQQLSSTAEHK